MQKHLGSQTRGTEREETTWMVGFIFKICQVWPFFLTSIILACDSISLLNGLSGLTLLPKPIRYLTFTEISLKFALEPCSMTTYSTLPNAKVPAEAHTVFPVFSDPACLRTPLCPLGFNTSTPACLLLPASVTTVGFRVVRDARSRVFGFKQQTG